VAAGAVLLAPPPAWNTRRMTRVLVAVDDSDGSVRAAETAHRLFGEAAEYFAVNVTNVVDLTTIPWYGAGWGAPYGAPYGAVWAYRTDLAGAGEGEGEEIAEAHAREVAEQSGLPDAEAVGEEGDPATAVLRAAEDHAVDVIVVGTEDRGWFDRLLRPSVSKEIVKHAHVPVLVVH
jgi:nucleotide-binding universal stress UspA family protein